MRVLVKFQTVLISSKVHLSISPVYFIVIPYSGSGSTKFQNSWILNVPIWRILQWTWNTVEVLWWRNIPVESENVITVLQGHGGNEAWADCTRSMYYPYDVHLKLCMSLQWALRNIAGEDLFYWVMSTREFLSIVSISFTHSQRQIILLFRSNLDFSFHLFFVILSCQNHYALLGHLFDTDVCFCDLCSAIKRVFVLYVLSTNKGI